MNAALSAYLHSAARGADHRTSVVAAAEAVADRPWEVVHRAGLLARCRLAVAPRDLGVTAQLRETTPGGRGAIQRIDQGQPYPSLKHPQRRARGAYDTPIEMARRVVVATLQACDGAPQTGLDLACGTGAFLLAMLEAGVPEVYGTDLDEVALDVARIAVPSARLLQEDALKHGPLVDVVCGNPPFIPPERQDRAMRKELRRRFPWLHGRFDLVVPFAAVAAERVRHGGGVGLVVPHAALVQPYGAVLRRRWAVRHAVTELSGPHPFPGASVDVMLLVMRIGGGPAPLPVYGMHPDELLRLENVPFNPDLMPGDVELVERIRACSGRLGDFALVDTGVVAHGPQGGKQRLLYDEAGEGRVPYADAREFFGGKRRWLHYLPSQMHRPKSPAMFEVPKIVVQRIRGRGPVRAAIDFDGVYVGHTCTVVVPRDDRIPLDRLLEVVRSPIVDALTRVERGNRLDLYPRDVAAFPVPEVWLEEPNLPLPAALGLDELDMERLLAVAAR